MTNYVLENDIDFYEELKKVLNCDDNEDVEKCLISGDDLDDTHITLCCGHKFNYLPLYEEIKGQKTKTRCRLDTTTMCLAVSDLRCPYCRALQHKLLPYKKLDGVDVITGVNFPEKYAMMTDNCKYEYLTGSKKGTICNVACNGTYCKKHQKVLDKRQQLQAFKKELQSELKDMTEEEIINHQYTPCTMILKSGKSKGQQCKVKCFKNGLCKRHYQMQLLNKDKEG
tara:strand:+ start:106 stop:783 length:678 start_codon:yes stop_codon:yes gene_type:complete